LSRRITGCRVLEAEQLLGIVEQAVALGRERRVRRQGRCRLDVAGVERLVGALTGDLREPQVAQAVHVLQAAQPLTARAELRPAADGHRRQPGEVRIDRRSCSAAKSSRVAIASWSENGVGSSSVAPRVS
jgi:hypothetical protein